MHQRLNSRVKYPEKKVRKPNYFLQASSVSWDSPRFFLVSGRPLRRNRWPLPPHEPGPGLVAEDRVPLRVASAGADGTGSD
jgi:hypothetical protein